MIQPPAPYGDAARPDRLPRPVCHVMLVCGPPCVGKSHYVREHARGIDTIIDLDEIALEYGYGRDRPADVVGLLLAERNRRLAGLAHQHHSHVAWVIISAPSAKLREWWREKLNAKVILLLRPREVLLARAAADPERSGTMDLQRRLIAEWFSRELRNNAGRIVRGCDESGWPSDPLHEWNAKPMP